VVSVSVAGVNGVDAHSLGARHVPFRPIADHDGFVGGDAQRFQRLAEGQRTGFPLPGVLSPVSSGVMTVSKMCCKPKEQRRNQACLAGASDKTANR